MKANQINMEVSSIAPALLALYACYRFLFLVGAEWPNEGD